MAITYQISVDNIFSAKDEDGHLIENRQPYVFVIKPYQRGYRWDPIHINHLIEDLLAFAPVVNENGKTINKNYCLQPIITKEVDKTSNQWELVDGQQRIISLWLMRRICFWFRRDPDEDDELYYSLRFINKPNLQNLVDEIASRTKEPVSPITLIRELRANEEAGNINYLHSFFGVTKGTNIDVDCMIECIRAILLYRNVSSVLEDIFASRDNNDPKSKSIQLVWYQLEGNNDSDEDAITVFSNINANKIKLTESELIKAQILYNLRGLEQRKEEEAKVAFRWEQIERSLCDDGFWYFLNAGEGKETGTRIDFLFEIWSKINDSTLGSVKKESMPEGWEKSDYPLSDLIENTIKLSDDKAKTALAIWKKICSLIDTLYDWKNDYYFYHIIGLLVAVNKILENNQTAADIVKRCIQEYQNISSKDDFREFLKSEIRKQMFAITKKNNFSDFVDVIESLSYEDSKDKKQIKVILLMHNIAALINAKNEHERFPFELFFSDKYDIEHVNPQNPDEENETALKEWYEAMGLAFDASKGTDQLFKEAKVQADQYSLHNIGNLVLLDENTNRAYKNKSFFEKRGEIINILRTGKRQKGNVIGYERYIPIGTKWVFLKAFSDIRTIDEASIHHIWDGEEEYKNDIIKHLWLLQSGYKALADSEVVYYEYDAEHGLVMCDKGLIIDSEGKYHYLEWNDDHTKLISRLGEVEIDEDKTNGLLPAGIYQLTSDGSCTRLSD